MGTSNFIITLIIISASLIIININFDNFVTLNFIIIENMINFTRVIVVIRVVVVIIIVNSINFKIVKPINTATTFTNFINNYFMITSFS